MTILKYAAAAVFIAGIAAASLTLAAGSGGHGHGDHDGASIGSPGTAPSRTVAIALFDNYYEPESLSIAQGETVKFVLTNSGDFVHEFNINTPEEHASHGTHMQMMVDMGMIAPDKINRTAMAASKGTDHDMSHDEPNSVLLEPGETRELIWTFNTDAELEFACNIPGHYDSGMAGAVNIHH